MMNWVLAALVIGGSVLIFGSHNLELGWWAEIMGDFGIAFLISGTLGITVEQYTKRKFIRVLSEDVFKATIGYTLPPALRKEMQWVSSQPLICEDHQQRVEIERIDNETVRFTCEIIRKLRNVTDQPFDASVGLGIDEWFGVEPSKILNFGYQIEDGQKVQLSDDQLATIQIDKGRPTLAVQPQKIRLPKNEKITVWMTFIEIKPINSDHNIHFAYGTESPRVWVRAPADIDFVAAFPRETIANKENFSRGHYAFNGFVLPGQEIRIRWWEAQKFREWKSSRGAQ